MFVFFNFFTIYFLVHHLSCINFPLHLSVVLTRVSLPHDLQKSIEPRDLVFKKPPHTILRTSSIFGLKSYPIMVLFKILFAKLLCGIFCGFCGRNPGVLSRLYPVHEFLRDCIVILLSVTTIITLFTINTFFPSTIISN